MATATGVDLKLLKSTKFPPEFNQKVDMTKVNIQVMKKSVFLPSSPSLSARADRNRWIANKVTEILGQEDDVVIELIFNLIEGTRNVRCPVIPLYTALVLTKHSRTSRPSRSS